MSVRRVRRSKRPPRTGLQTSSRKITQTLCRQRLSVESSHGGGYSLHKGTAGSDQNGRKETGWRYTSPMGQRKIHCLGFHCHPHVCGLLPPSVVIYTMQEGLRNMLRIESVTSSPLSSGGSRILCLGGVMGRGFF